MHAVWVLTALAWLEQGSAVHAHLPHSLCTAHVPFIPPQALLTPAAGAKASGLTPRDVFDDLQTPAPGNGGAGGDSAAEELGLLAAQHSARGSGERAAGGAPGTLSRRGTAGAGELEAPLTARSDVFDFLATPRTEAGAFAPPQASAAVAMEWAGGRGTGDLRRACANCTSTSGLARSLTMCLNLPPPAFALTHAVPAWHQHPRPRRPGGARLWRHGRRQPARHTHNCRWGRHLRWAGHPHRHRSCRGCRRCRRGSGFPAARQCASAQHGGPQGSRSNGQRSGACHWCHRHHLLQCAGGDQWRPAIRTLRLPERSVWPGQWSLCPAQRPALRRV